MSMNTTMATITLFGTTAITSVPGENYNLSVIPDWMQYGSFGLCCVMVVYLIYQIHDMGKIVREKDNKYIDLLEKEIKSRDKLSELLEDRPCITGDQRIKQ